MDGSSGTVSFATKTDNIGIAIYGLSTSSTATYNKETSLGIEIDTIYGYVKDATGNTESCSVTISATTTSTSTLNLTCDMLDDVSSEEEACTVYDNEYTYTSSNCSVTEMFETIEYICEATDGSVTCDDGTEFIYSPYEWWKNFIAITDLSNYGCWSEEVSSMVEPEV